MNLYDKTKLIICNGDVSGKMNVVSAILLNYCYCGVN